MRQIAAAFQLLTILPIRGSYPPGEGAIAFPLVGAILAAATAGIVLAAQPLFSANVAVLLALATLIAISGGFHEDGLADVFDALRAGRTRERMHAILKDSRIGAHGALALGITLLLRWQCIAAAGTRTLPVLVSALAASRGFIVTLAYLTPSAGDGLGKAFRSSLRAPIVATATLQAAAFPFLCGALPGAVALCANIAALWVARAWFQRRLGGVTGDCLGAACQISEIVTLLVLICPQFI